MMISPQLALAIGDLTTTSILLLLNPRLNRNPQDAANYAKAVK
jgi:hypothetical protein